MESTLQAESILLRGCIKIATVYPLLWLVANLDLQNFIVIFIACLGSKMFGGFGTSLAIQFEPFERLRLFERLGYYS
jgi:hypothetical protein